MIQIVGLRALAVGLIGSFLPMGLGATKFLLRSFTTNLKNVRTFLTGMLVAGSLPLLPRAYLRFS